MEKTDKSVKWSAVKNVLKQATEAALSSLIETVFFYEDILSNPMMSFAFCYLSSHFGLDIINEDLINGTMDYIEKKITGTTKDGDEII